MKRLQDRKLDALLGYCETVECRRHVLLGYFGEAYPAPCPNCDNCLQAVETWDGTVAAQKALSCVYRTGQRFGAAHLTDVLVGNGSATVQRHGHDRIKTFGAGQDLPPGEWRSVFRQLAAGGLLTVNMAEISGFRLTEKSWPVLKGEQPVRFRKDAQPLKVAKASRAAASRPAADLGDEASQSLFEKLRRLSLEIAASISLALRVDGTVVAWGYNGSDQATNVPSGLRDVRAVSAGGYHSLALRRDGGVVGWGQSAYGQITPPADLTNAVAIAAGGHHSLEQQLALEAELQAQAAETEDFQEGLAAFLGKRAPIFKGL